MENTENKGVKERLIEFINENNLNIHRFETIIGVSNGYVRNMRKSIQPDKLESIAAAFPELNISWLLTGKGEKKRTPTAQIGFRQQNVNMGNKEEREPSAAPVQDDIVKELLRQNAELIRQNGELIQMIKKNYLE